MSLPLWKRLLFWGIVSFGVPGVVLALLEGSSSLVLLARDLMHTEHVVTERAHTNYDTLLGWVNRANYYSRDLYGPGIYLRTNDRGFRNNHEIAQRVPKGRTRLICSGDSFTLGFGVDNDHTWCARLEDVNPRLETVNMGQGGYGPDQAYLWYKRDGRTLDHQLQVLAIIPGDFPRMRPREFLGFGKPVLALDGDTLRAENVPVPRWSYVAPRLASYLYRKRSAVRRLRMIELVQRSIKRIGGSLSPQALDPDSTTWLITDRMLKDLASINRIKHSRLVVVLLPTRDDWMDTASLRWRRWLAAAAPRSGFLYVDLIGDFRALPSESADRLFLPYHRDVYRHYGEQGHRWVAERLYQRLLALPEN